MIPAPHQRAAPRPSLWGDSELRRNTADAHSTTSRKSNITSKGSVRSSLRSSTTGGSERDKESKWLQAREYVLLLIEATMSLTAYVISERYYSVEELQRVELTRREFNIFALYRDGFSAMGSIFIGIMADSYFTHYTCAISTVVLHFTVVSLVFMEATVYVLGGEPDNPYAGPLSSVCGMAIVLIKSSDFTRLVYGLEGMINRRKSVMHTFIFLQFWVSSYSADGGIIVNVFAGLFNYFNIQLVIVAFIMSGLSLFAFVYLLSPEIQWKEQTGLACSVIGCLFLATYYKIFRIKKRSKRGFLGNTEGTYKKSTVSRTKEILVFYALVIPMFAAVFFTNFPADLFLTPLTDNLKSNNLIMTFGLRQLARTILATTMLLSFVFLKPLLNVMGLKKNVRLEFLVGHGSLALTWFYAAVVMRAVERFQYTAGDGFVRVFNTRDSHVSFVSLDAAFSRHNFTVPPKTGTLLAYPVPVEEDYDWLFPVLATFEDTKRNLTMFMSVTRLETTGYMILDPEEVVRIRGPYLPLREGPPGTNVRFFSKIYIYNTAKTLFGAVLQITPPYRKEVIRQLKIPQGEMLTIALEAGMYDFVIFRAEIRKTVNFEEGGLYGIMIYSQKSTRQLSLDVFRPGNSASVWAYLVLYFLFGISECFSYPSMRIITFNIAPRGLLAMCFSFLSFMEGMTQWICFIGFVTWHEYMTSIVLFAYASTSAGFFFFCMFVLLKYSGHYDHA